MRDSLHRTDTGLTENTQEHYEFEMRNKYPASAFPTLFQLYCGVSGVDGDGTDEAGEKITPEAVNKIKRQVDGEEELESFAEEEVKLYSAGLETLLNNLSAAFEDKDGLKARIETQKVIDSFFGSPDGTTPRLTVDSGLSFNDLLTVLEVCAPSHWVCFHSQCHLELFLVSFMVNHKQTQVP